MFRAACRFKITMATVFGLAAASAAQKPNDTPAGPSPLWETNLVRALMLQEQGRYSEADTAYRAALQDAERIGPDQPAVARILIGLGRLRTLQHDYSGARSVFERALMITEKTTGPEHMQIGLILANIAGTHYRQGHYNLAEVLYQRSLAVLEKTLGPQDPSTAITEASMAKLLLVEGRNTEAEAMYERAIPVLERSRQPDDSSLALVLTDLAEAYRADGSYAKAEPLYRRVLAMLVARPELSTGEIELGLRHFPLMLRKMKRKAEARTLDTQIKSILPKK